MKKLLFLIFCFTCIVTQAQTQYQIGLGAGYSFLQSVKMTSGTVGLKFKSDRYVFIDYNRMINKRHGIGLGAQFTLNFSSELYEPDKAIPYYSEKPHIPIFLFESAELALYIKKYFELLVAENNSIQLFVFLGPCFNMNEGNFNISHHSLRDDNGQTFQISRIVEKAQKPFIPYLRITSGLEFQKKFKKKYYLGISPFVSLVSLQSENNSLTVLRDDPTYISTGEFKRNRSGYGVRLIFSK